MLDRIGVYEIREQMSGCKTGTLYKAFDKRLQRFVALYVIDTAADDESLAPLSRFKAAAAIQHPNIAQVYDFGESGDVAFLASEFVEGYDVRNAAKHSLTLPQLIEVLVQIAGAIEHIYAAGLVMDSVAPMIVVTAQLKAAVFLGEFVLASRDHAGRDVTTFATFALEVLASYPPSESQPNEILRSEVVQILERAVHPNGATRYASITELIVALNTVRAEGRNKAAEQAVLQRMVMVVEQEHRLIGRVEALKQTLEKTLQFLACEDYDRAFRLLERAQLDFPHTPEIHALRDQIITEHHRAVGEIINEANRILAADHHERAIAFVQRARAAIPHNAELAELESVLRVAIEREERGREVGRALKRAQALRRDGDLQEALALLENTVRRSGSTTAQLESALIEIRKALAEREQRNRRKQDLDRGLEAMERGEYQSADAILSAALTEYPDDTELRAALQQAQRRASTEPQHPAASSAEVPPPPPPSPALGSAARGPAPAAASAPAQTPTIWDKNVQFTVYRPRAVSPEHWHDLLAFMHCAELPHDAPPGTADPIQQVRQRARRILGPIASRYRTLTQDSSRPIPRGGEVTFVPDVAGVQFNPPSCTFCWQETVHDERFRFRADRSLAGTLATGSLRIFLGSIIVAEVVLALNVTKSGETTAPAWAATTARVYRRIFASYSNKDVEIVKELEKAYTAIGDEYLRDVIKLRSGERWNDRLYQLIEQANIFQLFWSTNSMRSEFVRREWEHALKLGRSNFIRPVYWEDPLPEDRASGLPPQRLRDLHFHQLNRIQSSSTRRNAVRREALAMAALSATVIGGVFWFQTMSKHLDKGPLGRPSPPPPLWVASGHLQVGVPVVQLASARRGVITVVAALAGGRVRVWRGALLGESPLYLGPENTQALALSADGSRLATIDSDRVRVWDLATGQLVQAWAVRNVIAAAFSPDGSELAYTRSDGSLQILFQDGRTQQRLDSPGHPTAIVWSLDGETLALALKEGGIALISRSAGRLHQLLPSGRATTVTFVGSNRIAAALDRTIQVWDAFRGERVHLIHSDATILSLAATNDGSRIAAGFASTGRISVWSTTDPDLVQSGPDGDDAISALTFSGDAALFSGSLHGTIQELRFRR